MNIKYFNILIFKFLILLMISSCKKNDEVGATGKIIISFNPEADSSVPESYYFYVYVFNERFTSSPLEKRYVNSVMYINNVPTVTFDKLNAGNYIFSYYKGRMIIDNTIQVRPGKINMYVLQ